MRANNYNWQRGYNLSEQLELMKKTADSKNKAIDNNVKNGIINREEKNEGRNYPDWSQKQPTYYKPQNVPSDYLDKGVAPTNENLSGASSSVPNWAKPIAERFSQQYREAYTLREENPPSRAFYDEKMRNARIASERLQDEIQEIRKMTSENPANGQKYGEYIRNYYHTTGEERDKYDELAFWLSREHAKYLNSTENLIKPTLLKNSTQDDYAGVKANSVANENNNNKHAAISITGNSKPLTHNQAEFGKNSHISKALDGLGTEWHNAENADEQEAIHQKAELLRGLARTYFTRGNTDQRKLLEGYNVVIKYESRIKAVADTFKINPHLLATTLFREVTMSSWDDYSLIEMGAAHIGFDTSIGLSQIKASRATEAYDHWLSHLQGDSYRGHNLSKLQIARKLKDPNENIRFLGMVLWDTMHSRGIWDEQDIYTSYNGATIYGEGSMQYAPYFWSYFN